MSAYLCNPETIAIIADYGFRHVAGMDDARQIALTLLRENVRSVAHRYELTAAGVYKDFSALTPKQYRNELFRQLDELALKRTGINIYNTPDNHKEVFAACRQLDYQSCERQDYGTSKACSIIAQVAFESVRHLINP